MKHIEFSKMHGLGNHFMVIDTTKQDILLTPEKIKNWASHQTGVGFDQLMVITHRVDLHKRGKCELAT